MAGHISPEISSREIPNEESPNLTVVVVISFLLEQGGVNSYSRAMQELKRQSSLLRSWKTDTSTM